MWGSAVYGFFLGVGALLFIRAAPQPLGSILWWGFLAGQLSWAAALCWRRTGLPFATAANGYTGSNTWSERTPGTFSRAGTFPSCATAVPDEAAAADCMTLGRRLKGLLMYAIRRRSARPGLLVRGVAGSLVIVLGACAPRIAASPPPSASFATAAGAACEPSPIQTSPFGLSEIQGTMRSDGELWALLFFGRARANEEVKIVWRITGNGQFSAEATHEDGTIISPIGDPKAHSASNWERPGLEWGTRFTFPRTGCWTLTGVLGTTNGEIRIEVEP